MIFLFAKELWRIKIPPRTPFNKGRRIIPPYIKISPAPPFSKGNGGDFFKAVLKIHFAEYVIVSMNMCTYFSGICGGRLGDSRYRLTAQEIK